MQVMRKFIIDLKSDGTIKWAEVADNKTEYNAYKNALIRIVKFIDNDISAINSYSGQYFDGKVDAYKEILTIIIDGFSKRG